MHKILLIGKSGRVDVLAETFFRGHQPIELYSLSEVRNPGLLGKSKQLEIGKTDDVGAVVKFAKKVRPDFAVIGPEEPLAAGVVDALWTRLGIPSVGPTSQLAQIESSKSFARRLLAKYGIPGNPEFRVFRSLDGLEPYLRALGEFVIKPDGLTGGKGVKIFREHVHSIQRAVEYCEAILGSKTAGTFVIEEKLEGEEFSLQSFCDGQHVVDTIPVQDHKRAFENDSGPNTGGMGSYSCENHMLPFLTAEHLRQASEINAAVAEAVRNEFGEEYKGILYGGFMLTKDGVRLIEYNARFGDPEVMNVLPLLRTDFVEVCIAMLSGSLDKLKIEFERKATVCKYLVPRGYPETPTKGEKIKIDETEPSDDKRMYYGAVNQTDNGLYLIGSRAVACVGIGNTLEEAEGLAEEITSRIHGPIRHRKDIGTRSLIQKRIDHARAIINSPAVATSESRYLSTGTQRSAR